MSKIWMCSGSTYTQVDSNYKVAESLPIGVYNISLTMTGFKLNKYTEKFVFPYKVYGLQKDFIAHVLETYKHTVGNLGILLTGTKGTGKTVTAKELANKLNLPVIIVQDMGDNNQAMIEYLSNIEGDCILFLDEFEKNFKTSDSTILQIMDGVYNSNYRKVFLLTTNEMKINDNLIGRPSRIRYVKKFNNLDLEVVNEYLDDTLTIPEARQGLLDFIDSLTISTIDILKTLVDEINIHGLEGLKKIKDFFNVITNKYDYTCIRGYAHSEELSENKTKYSIENFTRAVERFLNPIPKPVVQNEESCTAAEQIALNEYYNYRKHNFHNLTFQYIKSDIKFSNLKPGDIFYSETVVKVDIKSKVMVTQEGDIYNYYWVQNPESSPSLYKNTGNSLIS